MKTIGCNAFGIGVRVFVIYGEKAHYVKMGKVSNITLSVDASGESLSYQVKGMLHCIFSSKDVFDNPDDAFKEILFREQEVDAISD